MSQVLERLAVKVAKAKTDAPMHRERYKAYLDRQSEKDRERALLTPGTPTPTGS